MINPQVRYLNFPQIPSILTEEVVDQLSDGKKASRIFQTYSWTNINKTKIEDWCNENISENLIWGLQVITGDLRLHRDHPTKTKVSYILETGGDNVVTEFYKDFNEEPSNILHAIKIEAQRWHILNVDLPHKVVGIEPNKVRISLTGRIF